MIEQIVEAVVVILYVTLLLFLVILFIGVISVAV